MQLERSGFGNLFSRFRRGRKGAGRNLPRGRRSFGRRALLEQLEERRLLVSRVFLDFGDNFGSPTDSDAFSGTPHFDITQQQQTFNANWLGSGAPANFAGVTSIFASPVGVMGTTGITLASTGNIFNNPTFSPTIVPMDLLTFEIAVTEQVRRALEPFDIQVYSSAPGENIPFLTFISGGAADVRAELAANNIPGDGRSNLDGTATVPQFGSDDAYVLLSGVFATGATVAPALFPISFTYNEFIPGVTNSAGGNAVGSGRPQRMDTGAVIDVNYWIERVLGNGSETGTAGTGGSLNTAVANAALYAIGADFGLSEVENGVLGPNTNFFDPNIAELNQANAMVEAGFTENISINGITVEQPSSDQ